MLWLTYELHGLNMHSWQPEQICKIYKELIHTFHTLCLLALLDNPWVTQMKVSKPSWSLAAGGMW